MHTRRLVLPHLFLAPVVLAGLYKHWGGGYASETAAEVVTAPNPPIYKQSEPARQSDQTRLWLFVVILCPDPQLGDLTAATS